MVKLNLIEKEMLEDLLGMNGGYVLKFTDATFASFFQDFNINIDDPKYTRNKRSGSKANRLRGFWELEDCTVVGEALTPLIALAEYLNEETGNEKLIYDCRNIANRLTGRAQEIDTQRAQSDFLAVDFGRINFSKLPIESQVQIVLEARLSEAQICLENGANLAVIFMAGSILEGALYGVANEYPRQFNESPSCPKDENGKPKRFDKWTLLQFINVGKEIGLLGEDVKKFTHELRDFRNYIHPYCEMTSGFRPGKDTAEICLQVLKAALSNLIENKPNG